MPHTVPRRYCPFFFDRFNSSTFNPRSSVSTDSFLTDDEEDRVFDSHIPVRSFPSREGAQQNSEKGTIFHWYRCGDRRRPRRGQVHFDERFRSFPIHFLGLFSHHHLHLIDGAITNEQKLHSHTQIHRQSSCSNGALSCPKQPSPIRSIKYSQFRGFQAWRPSNVSSARASHLHQIPNTTLFVMSVSCFWLRSLGWTLCETRTADHQARLAGQQNCWVLNSNHQ